MSRSAQRAEHGTGLNLPSFGSRRKSVVVTNGAARCTGSLTIVVTVNHSWPSGSENRSKYSVSVVW
jgi:mRNA-degrading endonuclease toxin of MazEF toxin-antitoxin module